jgi:hypothetical protein
MYSRTSTPFAAGCEAFSNVYPERSTEKDDSALTGNNSGTEEVFVTSSRRATKHLKLRPFLFQAVLSCNNGVQLQ